jgi:Cd2+/Zn2+-exporting ATPase
MSEKTFVYRVDGMDCASCAAKLERAIGNVKGVKSVKVSVAKSQMSTNVDESADSQQIEGAVKSLGYRPTRLEAANDASPALAEPTACAGHDHASHDHKDHKHTSDEKADHGHSHDHGAPIDGAWWKTPKAYSAGIGLVLIAASYLISLSNETYGSYAFLIALLIMLYPIASHAFAAAKLKTFFTIEMLMTIAAIGAIIIGEVEEAAIVVLLFTIGELLEGFAAAKARSGIKALASLVPKTAFVDENGALREVPVESLTVGQVIVARPGDRIAADGEVISGQSSVDESPMTGESVPVAKDVGAKSFAGSINLDGSLRIKVERTSEDNTIARIITLVEEAQEARAPTERFIDTFSRYYMPIIVGIAVLTAIIPPLFAGADWDTWIYRALALLLIGCPCALVISVPASIASSLSAAARNGMLIKGGAVLEALAKAEVVAFDKTGTLTLGKPKVTDAIAIDGDVNRLLSDAMAIEEQSSHPLAEAIVAHGKSLSLSAANANHVKAIAGRGMSGVIAGREVFIGAPRFAKDYGVISDEVATQIDALEREGKTVSVVMEGGQLTGLLALRDEPREEAAKGVASLKEIGVDSLMLSGDNSRTANAIAAKLGMSARGELLPQDKVSEIRKLTAEKTTIMVGDGINDAPALAAASVGIAIGSGTDVAMEAADAALMRSNIGDVSRLINLSRATMSNIRQNVVIALGLKAVFLVTTLLGLTGLWLAIFADTGATVLVTANAMRLLGYFRKG